MAERETRMVPMDVEVRKGAEGPVIEGYGAVFDQETIIGGFFREQIARGAFRDSLKEDDIHVYFNHDPNVILATTENKTADVTEDKTGLRYVARLDPDDPDTARVTAKIRRKSVRGSSFSFHVENDDDEVWKRDDPAKLPLRIIKRARLFEVGPVTNPAYPQTSVSARTKAEAAIADAEQQAREGTLKAMEVALAERKAWAL